MADLSITAANVVAVADKTYGILTGKAGATITAGQMVYLDSSAGTWKLADANAADSTASGSAGNIGVALNGAASGQPITVQVGGNLNPGASLTAGVTYVLSATAGGIAPIADVTTGWRVFIVGTATSSSNMVLINRYTGATA